MTKGLRFELTFGALEAEIRPREAGHLRPQRARASPRGAISALIGSIAMGTLAPRPVILVVDDEPMLRMYATDIMEEAGFDVLEAANGPQAFGIFEAHPEITALVTDIQMPGGYDGLALARKIYARRPEVRLILTSGNVKPAGSDIPDHGRFVSKPYDETAVRKILTER